MFFLLFYIYFDFCLYLLYPVVILYIFLSRISICFPCFSCRNFNISGDFDKEKTVVIRTTVFLVGVMRFELMAFCTPCKRATKLRHTPATLIIILGLFQKIKYYFQKMIKNFQIVESLDFSTIFGVKKPAPTGPASFLSSFYI